MNGEHAGRAVAVSRQHPSEVRTMSKKVAPRFFAANPISVVKSARSGFAASASSTEGAHAGYAFWVSATRVCSSESNTTSGYAVVLGPNHIELAKLRNASNRAVFSMHSPGGSRSCR